MNASPIEYGGRQFASHDELLAYLEQEKYRVLAEKKERMSEVFRNLHGQFGLNNVDELIYALAEFSSTPLRARLLGEIPGVGPVSVSTRRRSGSRKKVTSEVRSRIEAALRAGRTARSISEEQNLSTATINLIKKEIGLVRTRRAELPEE